MASPRRARIQEMIKENLGTLIDREIKDPRVGLVTITRVQVSPDISTADIFVSVYGSDEDREASLTGLKSAKGHLRSRLGRSLQTKNTPELKFHMDNSAEYGVHISKVLRKVNASDEAVNSDSAEEETDESH